jgi:hypothetical protein
MHQPDFFLSSASEQWAPRVVSVQRKDETIGIVYTRERKIAGLPSGLIFADGSLTGMWIGDRNQQDVFRVALERLLAYRLVQGICLIVLAGSPELQAIRSIVASDRLDVHFRRIKPHARLSLPKSYEEFLQGLLQYPDATSGTIADGPIPGGISILSSYHSENYILQLGN